MDARKCRLSLYRFGKFVGTRPINHMPSYVGKIAHHYKSIKDNCGYEIADPENIPDKYHRSIYQLGTLTNRAYMNGNPYEHLHSAIEDIGNDCLNNEGVDNLLEIVDDFEKNSNLGVGTTRKHLGKLLMNTIDSIMESPSPPPQPVNLPEPAETVLEPTLDERYPVLLFPNKPYGNVCRYCREPMEPKPSGFVPTYCSAECNRKQYYLDHKEEFIERAKQAQNKKTIERRVAQALAAASNITPEIQARLDEAERLRVQLAEAQSRLHYLPPPPVDGQFVLNVVDLDNVYLSIREKNGGDVPIRYNRKTKEQVLYNPMDEITIPSTDCCVNLWGMNDDTLRHLPANRRAADRRNEYLIATGFKQNARTKEIEKESVDPQLIQRASALITAHGDKIRKVVLYTGDKDLRVIALQARDNGKEVLVMAPPGQRAQIYRDLGFNVQEMPMPAPVIHIN